MVKALQIYLYLSIMLGSVQCNSQVDTANDFNGDRVAQARHLVGEQLAQDLVAKGFKPGAPIFIRALKSEQQLEVWIQDSLEFRHFRTYPICRVPGLLGPKRKEGDLQVPEGLYWIEVFNPKSSYHLSMGINYPNESDRILSDPKKPGGEIYIHGNCVSVGCLPITDEKIRELYLLASDARDAGQQQIPVHIFPCRMTQENRQNLLTTNRPELLPFWDNLGEAYDFFETQKQIVKYKVDEVSGRYVLER